MATSQIIQNEEGDLEGRGKMGRLERISSTSSPKTSAQVLKSIEVTDYQRRHPFIGFIYKIYYRLTNKI